MSDDTNDFVPFDFDNWSPESTLNDEEVRYWDVVDPDTGRIEFRKQHPAYITLKSVFLTVGINIDEITTETKLLELELTYSKQINDYIVARALNRQNPSLEQQLVNATIRGDDEEHDRIEALLLKRNKMKLKIV